MRARVRGCFCSGVRGARRGPGRPWGCPGELSPLHSLRPGPDHTLLLAGQVEGRLGPSTVVLDHTGGFEGLLLVDDDLLGVSECEARAGPA